MHTERLFLKKISNEHRELIFALRSNPMIIKYTGIPQYTDIAQADSYIERMEQAMMVPSCYIWAIYIKADNKPVGSVCLWNFSQDGKIAELGYDLLPDYWGRGYASEAVSCVLSFGFSQGRFEKITAVPRRDNTSSTALLKKCGFICTGDFDESGENFSIYEKLSNYAEYC